MTKKNRGLTKSAVFCLLSCTILCWGSWYNPARAEIKVIASIKPIHSIVAAVMEGVGEPQVLVEGFTSAHQYSLKPSDAQRLHSSDVIFWVGPGLESYLEKPLSGVPSPVDVVRLDQTDGLTLYPVRDSDFDENGDRNHHDHDHFGTDLHFWLDPENAVILGQLIAEKLAQHDPDNQQRYRMNALTFAANINQQRGEIAKRLEGHSDIPFLVLHDAYQYFERRFGLQNAGAIMLNPEVSPGAQRLRSLREKISQTGVRCIFKEPQMSARLVSVIKEGFDIEDATLDPLGASLDKGAGLYSNLLDEMANSFATCLKPRPN